MLLEIFQRINNVHAQKNNVFQRIVGGKPADPGKQIEITNQIDILFSFKNYIKFLDPSFHRFPNFKWHCT